MIRLEGRTISGGRAEGEAVVLDGDFSFLGGVDPATGDLRVPPHANIRGKVLVFPRGRGSTVGSFTMYDLMVKGNAPAAIVNLEAETIVATGAVISSIPLVDRVDISVIETGDRLEVDASEGTVSMPGLRPGAVVASVLMRGGRALMLRRSHSVATFPGQWTGVSGTVEEGEAPVDTARREIMEETGLEVGLPDRVGTPFLMRSEGTVWTVHPYLFLMEGGDPVLNWENDDFAWMNEGEFAGLDTIPGLKRVFSDLRAWEG